jgi:hypothetical protein
VVRELKVMDFERKRGQILSDMHVIIVVNREREKEGRMQGRMQGIKWIDD